MNPPMESAYASGAAETTLRLIARLPVPDGLADRVQARVREEQEKASHATKVLPWPADDGSAQHRMPGNLVRRAAVAAIVFVVVGGGWGVYSRVQPPATRVIVMPPRVAAPGGFSSAGAMRTPRTLNGPVVLHPVVQQPVPANAATSATKAAKAHDPAKKAAKSRKIGQLKPAQ